MSESNPTVPVPLCVTSDYLEKMLRNFLGENSIKIEKYLVAPGTSIRVNYIGCQILRIEIDYIRNNQNEKRSIIAKVLPQSEAGQKTYDNEIKTEIKMTSEALPLLFKELRSKVETERFFPYAYLSDVQNGIIFMEDLKADGYTMMNVTSSSFNLDHSLLVVKTIAKIHASSFLLLLKNPDIKSDYLQIFWKKSDRPFPGKVMDASYTYFLKFLHLWPVSEEDKNIFRSFEGKLCDLMAETYKRRESSFNVLIHGDCWMENIMFKYKNEKVECVKFLDYQLCNYNSIALDIIQFLFTCAKDYVKVQHLEEILQTYYETFVSITGQIEGFSLDTVKKEFKERLAFGFVLAATLRCMMISVDRFDYDAFLEDEECLANDKMFSNKEFISEFVNILPLFKKFGVFKMASS